MTTPRTARLSDRGLVSVTGEDAGKLLQGLVTNDVALLAVQPAIFAGLLAPQGKILFDFIITRSDNGYLLETAADQAAGLARRLQLYKLRAAVEIADVSERYAVDVMWDDGSVHADSGVPDPRLADLGRRAVVPRASARTGESDGPARYHAHRIALGVPEGGKDYAYGDTFPHEALYDEINGVSFTKGCFVGQEVVSRMEHRGTARKRIVPVVADAPLPAPGSEIKAGDVVVGTLGSVAGARGLALLRLDRVAELTAKGGALRAADVPVRIELPAFATFAMPAAPQTAE